MRYFCILLICCIQGFAQSNVWVKGCFDGFPSSKYQIFLQDSLRFISNVPLHQGKTDQEGNFKVDFALAYPQKVVIECLGYQLDFFLTPQDTLIFHAPNRSTLPIVKGKTARLHDFLYKSLLMGKDSLAANPLFQHMSLENYTVIINDLAAQSWENFRHQCDTTDPHINKYVWASLEGQKYFRKQAYLFSKGELAKQELIRPAITEDSLYVSGLYMQALHSFFLSGPDVYVHPNSAFRRGAMSLDSIALENKYHQIYETLSKIPKTRQILLAQFIRMYFFPYMYIEGKKLPPFVKLLEKYKEDFPSSLYIAPLERYIKAPRSEKLFLGGPPR